VKVNVRQRIFFCAVPVRSCTVSVAFRSDISLIRVALRILSSKIKRAGPLGSAPPRPHLSSSDVPLRRAPGSREREVIATYLVPEAPQGARSDPIPPLATSSAIGQKSLESRAVGVGQNVANEREPGLALTWPSKSGGLTTSPDLLSVSSCATAEELESEDELRQFGRDHGHGSVF
jgi:hypothetical protein